MEYKGIYKTLSNDKYHAEKEHLSSSNLKTVSFLLHSDHGFDQAPLEEITRQEYENMVKSVKPITDCEVNEEDIKGSFECATGMCPIK